MAHVRTKNGGYWKPESTHEKVDSQKIFIDNINQQEINYTDLIRRIHTKVNSINELKALDVTSSNKVIDDGTLALVTGYGIYYYNPLSEAIADDEEIVEPTEGGGRWILAGGGGNLIVDENDYGEDTDTDGVVLKIKKLFNKKLKKNFFPITTTKAVRITKTSQTLDEALGSMVDTSDEVETEEIVRDVDTLGGKYRATDIDMAMTYESDEGEEVEEVQIVDADRLGGKYTAIDIDEMSNKLHAITGLTSDEYNNLRAYSVGEYCICNNKLYKCITSITEPEEFNSTKWKETNCATEFSQLNSNLSKKQDKIVIENVLIAENRTIPGNETHSFEVPNKDGGYSAFVLRPYLDGAWSDKYALVGVWNSPNRFSIRNISGTDYTWSIYCTVMYVPN